MIYKMTKREERILKRIAKRIVSQSYVHKKNVIKYYEIIYNAARAEFTEDNKPALDDFLDECHKRSIGN